MNKTQEFISALRKKGLSKWRISKELSVSWQTIHMWEKGVFQATKNNIQRLEELSNRWK